MLTIEKQPLKQRQLGQPNDTFRQQEKDEIIDN
jgi:hypothetical protein